MNEMSREQVERLAYIMGDFSAAANALRAAATYERPVFFRDGAALVVFDDAKLDDEYAASVSSGEAPDG